MPMNRRQYLGLNIGMLAAIANPHRTTTTRSYDNVISSASYVIDRPGSKTRATGVGGLPDASDTDAAKVIQHTIDNVPQNGTVFCLNGTYDLTRSGPLVINHPKEVNVIGESRAMPAGEHLHQRPTSGVLFDTSGRDMSAIQINKGGSTPEDKISPTIRNITFNGSGPANGFAAIDSDVTDVARYEDLTIRCYEWAIDDSPTGTASEYVGNMIIDVGNGIRLARGASIVTNNRFFATIPGYALAQFDSKLARWDMILGNWFMSGRARSGTESIHISRGQHLLIGYNYIAWTNAGISLVNVSDSFLGPNVFDNSQGDGVNKAIYIGGNSSDIEIATQMWPGQMERIDNNGSRIAYNGVIGGGPLGGADLSTMQGRYLGDSAMSKGFVDARWTGSSWQPSSGDDPITPG